ncbi:hypothetical protein [Nocardia sp. bgisy134]|uniref:TPR repeat region-containing protein n=1 Tax=Nocardia sp. bgisy134 TaxID=3413789 RepID=UPI003D761198
MPTRPQVTDWKPFKLSEWAAEMETDTQGYETQLARMITHFTGTTWSGKAHDAAADRFTEERTQGLRLVQEIKDIANALRAADTRLSDERATLLGRVTDAENDAECPLPLVVTEKWVVSANASGFHLSGEDQQKVKDRVLHHQGLINAAYYAMQNAASEASAAISAAAQEVRVRGDLIGSGLDAEVAPSDAGKLGNQDGSKLAEWANTPEHQRNPALLAEVANQLPTHALTDEQLKILSEGGEVDTLPASVQEYYKELYKTGGKEGILGLSEYLQEQEKVGNPEAATQLDSLANGLMVISNEDIGTGRGDDGKLTGTGNYENVPKEFRELLEAKRTDINPIGTDPSKAQSPTVLLQQQHEDTSALAALLSESNPGYEPGTQLGTKMYEKAADMVQDQYTWNDRDEAAAAFANLGGRNDDSAHQIWTGEGMGDKYDRDETVRTLLGYEKWPDEGKGASTLIDRITEESQLPADDPRYKRAQNDLAEMNAVLNPDNETFEKMKKSFSENDELSNAMSRAVANNLEAVSSPGNQQGYSFKTDVYDGKALWHAETADRFLQLSSFTEESRLNLTTAVEQYHQSQLTQALNGDPNDLAGVLSASDVGSLTGRIDSAMIESLVYQDKEKGDAITNPEDAVYKAKMMGIGLAGGLLDEGIGKIPGATTLGGMIGLEPGELLSEGLEEWIKPDYEYMERPPNSTLYADAHKNAQIAILNAAFDANQLPPTLHNGGQPFSIEAIQADRTMWSDFTRFLNSHGLNQYLTDYGQSYSMHNDQANAPGDDKEGK